MMLRIILLICIAEKSSLQYMMWYISWENMPKYSGTCEAAIYKYLKEKDGVTMDIEGFRDNNSCFSVILQLKGKESLFLEHAPNLWRAIKPSLYHKLGIGHKYPRGLQAELDRFFVKNKDKIDKYLKINHFSVPKV
jgi:hypothetical protein